MSNIIAARTTPHAVGCVHSPTAVVFYRGRKTVGEYAHPTNYGSNPARPLRAFHVAFALTFTAIAVCGCQNSRSETNRSISDSTTTVVAPATDPASTQPQVPAILLYDDKKFGVQFQYPATWIAKPDKEYLLQLVPAVPDSDRRILFDVPDLPWHLPFMINTTRIENGYVTDLQEIHKGAHVDNSVDHPMGQGAMARLVEASWTDKGVVYKSAALLVLRDDHVYVLTYRSAPPHLESTRADFQKIMASLRWTR